MHGSFGQESSVFEERSCCEAPPFEGVLPSKRGVRYSPIASLGGHAGGCCTSSGHRNSERRRLTPEAHVFPVPGKRDLALNRPWSTQPRNLARIFGTGLLWTPPWAVQRCHRPGIDQSVHRGRDQHRPGRVPSTSRQRIRSRGEVDRREWWTPRASRVLLS